MVTLESKSFGEGRGIGEEDLAGCKGASLSSASLSLDGRVRHSQSDKRREGGHAQMFSLHLYSEVNLPACPPRDRPTDPPPLAPGPARRTGINLAQKRSNEAERGRRPNQ